VKVATLAFALIAAAWFLPSALQRDDRLGYQTTATAAVRVNLFETISSLI